MRETRRTKKWKPEIWDNIGRMKKKTTSPAWKEGKIV